MLLFFCLGSATLAGTILPWWLGPPLPCDTVYVYDPRKNSWQK
jgi:hypothetical protein